MRRPRGEGAASKRVHVVAMRTFAMVVAAHVKSATAETHRQQRQHLGRPVRVGANRWSSLVSECDKKQFVATNLDGQLH